MPKTSWHNLGTGVYWCFIIVLEAGQNIKRAVRFKMKKILFLFGLIILGGCTDPSTGRDSLGNIWPGEYSRAESMGGNKYFVEAQQRIVAIRGAKSECARMGKTAEIISVDAPENAYVMAIFTCD